MAKKNILVHFWQVYQKAFYCHSLKLLLAELHLYVFSLATLRSLHSYLTNRKKEQKYTIMTHGRKSCLEFHMDIYNHSFVFQYIFLSSFLYFERHQVWRYADDNTPMLHPKILTMLLAHSKKIPLSYLSGFDRRLQ